MSKEDLSNLLNTGIPEQNVPVQAQEKKEENIVAEIKIYNANRQESDASGEKQKMLDDVISIFKDYLRKTTPDGSRKLTEDEKRKLWDSLDYRAVSSNFELERERLDKAVNICMLMVAYDKDALPVGCLDSAYEKDGSLAVNLLIRDGFEGKGISTKLMREQLIQAKKIGIKKIKGEVKRGNERMCWMLDGDEGWHKALNDLCYIYEDYNPADPFASIKGPALRDPEATKIYVLELR